MILKIKKLSIKDTWIKDINLTLLPSTSVAVLGPSGCGKTALLECLSGIKQNRINGEIIFHNKEIEQTNKIQFVPSEDKEIFNSNRTLESILDETYLIPQCVKDWRKEVLVMPDLSKLFYKRVCDITNMEKQRFACFRALLFEPEILICDELMSSSKGYFHKNDKLINSFEQAKDNGTIIILSSKNILLMERLCDTFIIIKKNCTAMFYSAHDLLSLFKETYEYINCSLIEGIEKLIEDNFISDILFN